MKIFHSDKYFAEINSIMPIEKFGLVRDSIEKYAEKNEIPVEIAEPKPASMDDLLEVHSKDYVDAVFKGIMPLAGSNGFKWTSHLPISVSYTNGGCIEAAREALENKVSANLASGFHHAAKDYGNGFCTFNGLAVAIMKMIKEKRIEKAFVLDADAHYGNGTARIFENNPNVFTYSICGSAWDLIKDNEHSIKREMPYAKPKPYLHQLEKDLELIDGFKPDLLIYQAGADPYKLDALGYMHLDIDDFNQRDAMIFKKAKELNIPIMWVLAGGYPKHDNPVDNIVKIHTNTFITAHEIFEKSA